MSKVKGEGPGRNRPYARSEEPRQQEALTNVERPGLTRSGTGRLEPVQDKP